ncbi:MAG: zinc-dependent metalloprotease [Thermoleophilaceae bacterium]
MVDWSLARQIARFAAGSQESPDLKFDFPVSVAEAEQHLADYTRLALTAPIPEPERVDRAQWAEINLGAMEDLLGPVTKRLATRLDGAGPLAGPLRATLGATIAAEAGLVMGYMSQRVLGQYELSLLAPEQAPRLLFVTPNLGRAVADLKIDRDSFLGWVVLHELTHVFQFSGVPWLRAHLGGLLEEYLATVDVRVERGAAGGLPSIPDLQRLVERFREGGLIALVQSKEQRRIMDGVQSAMAVIEGYSEHVMDAVGEQVLPAYAGLREAMERRRRSRSAPERILQRLLGLDMKMRQYELGKSFCDGVVERRGIETLNRVWSEPAALPSMAELNDPAAWIDRVEGTPLAA